MKKIKFESKLNINKNMISRLNETQLVSVKGGRDNEAAAAAPLAPVHDESGCSKTGGCGSSEILNCGG